jgi:hypothetical protein
MKLDKFLTYSPYVAAIGLTYCAAISPLFAPVPEWVFMTFAGAFMFFLGGSIVMILMEEAKNASQEVKTAKIDEPVDDKICYELVLSPSLNSKFKDLARRIGGTETDVFCIGMNLLAIALDSQDAGGKMYIENDKVRNEIRGFRVK